MRVAQERFRGSFFYVPTVFIIGAVLVGEAALAIDTRVENIPVRLTATVDSARQVLSLIAGATLSFAAIAFSVSLLLISLASSQYSPRVAHGFFRDPFNKRVMGIVVGTFTYCLVALRTVRGPLEQGGDPIVPSISILVAVALGVVSILSIVAFISHSAHSMDVSNILHRATEEALERVRGIEASAPTGGTDGTDDVETPPGDGLCVTFADHGWIQQVDYDALLRVLDPRSTMRLDMAPGRYAITGTPLCTIWPAPPDEERARAGARAAVVVGVARTMQQDVTYGVRQLADVALKALSPGINDPTTAQDALFHLGTVLREVIVRAPRDRRVVGEDQRQLLLSDHVTPVEAVALAFDEVRIAAVGAPTVQVYVLEILRLLTDSLRPEIEGEVIAALHRQADLVLETAKLADLAEADFERVARAHHARFAA